MNLLFLQEIYEDKKLLKNYRNWTLKNLKVDSYFYIMNYYKKRKNLIQKEGENNDDLENDENDYFVCMTNDSQIPIIDIL